ncbi:MAG: aldose 1-epimerase family protein [Clostridia bacterium]|nr:aldose 1-epimerase family protein [Clostridia bacterium]
MMEKNKLFEYTGDLSQIFYARPFTFSEGRANGMRGIEVSNGSGLQFTILPDRAMDIGLLSFRGVNFSYITKAGLSAPWHYDDRGLGWLKTFNGGFLTTCGLTQAGSPCTSDGENLGQHGDISAAQAEDMCIETNLDGDYPEIIIRGKMRSGVLFGRSLWLYREYRIKPGENKISMKDTVENRGESPQPYMILYHYNLGYPLLDETIDFQTNADYIRPRDAEAEKGIGWREGFIKPESGFREQVFYYKSSGDKCYAGIHNKRLDTGVKIYVKQDQLPNIIQWKNAGYGDYVMGIEPANCYPEGREKQREYGLEYISPMEKKIQEIIIEVY